MRKKCEEILRNTGGGKQEGEIKKMSAFQRSVEKESQRHESIVIPYLQQGVFLWLQLA